MRQKYTTNDLMDFIKKYVDDLENPGKLVVAKIADHCRKKYANAYGLQAYDFRNNKEVKDFIDRYNEELRTRYITEHGAEEHLLESTLDIEMIMQRCKSEKDFRKALIEISEELERLREANNILIKANQKHDNDLRAYSMQIELKNAAIERLEYQNKNMNRQINEKTREIDLHKRLEGKYLKYINDNLLYGAMIDHFVDIGFIHPEPGYSCKEEARELELGIDGNVYEKMKEFFLNYDVVTMKVIETSDDNLDEEETEYEIDNENNHESIDFRQKWAERFSDMGSDSGILDD